MNVGPKKFRRTIAALLLGVMGLAAPASHAAGLYTPDEGATTPAEAIKDVVVTEHKGSRIPLDLTFTDEIGKTVRLGEYFNGKKPVIIQLGYYGCPMLCGLISRGLIDSVKKVSPDCRQGLRAGLRQHRSQGDARTGCLQERIVSE